MSNAWNKEGKLSPWLKGRWIWILLPLLLLLGVRLGPTLWASAKSSAASADEIVFPVIRETVPVLITANGTVGAERSINLGPKNAGVVTRLLVEEGDRLQQGQVIALMDDTNLRGELIQMQGQLAQAQANLDRLLAGDRPQEIAQSNARLRQVQTTLQQADANLQRYEALSRAGAISKEERDQKRADRDVALAQVNEAQESLALQTAGTRSEEIIQAQAQVQSALGMLASTEAKLRDTQIAAPFDGVVSEIYAELGSFVSPSFSGGDTESSSSSSILMLSSVRNQVVVNLPESQISKVQPGQPVVITADAFPGERFTGSIEHVADRATVSQNVTSFEVRISINGLDATLTDAPPAAPRPNGRPPHRPNENRLPKSTPRTEASAPAEPASANASRQLRIGMNVETQFKIGQLENALLVPNAAIVRRSKAEGVYVLEDGEKTFRPIQTGATAGGRTEVQFGLEENEQVLVSPPEPRKRRDGLNFPPPPPGGPPG